MYGAQSIEMLQVYEAPGGVCQHAYVNKERNPKRKKNVDLLHVEENGLAVV
mgnify:CR=1 FL=1